MPDNRNIRIPESALSELDQMEKMDWGPGFGLEELVASINQIVERFLPDSSAVGRSSAEFTPRSFRHYQTLGCIDPPKRAGKSVVYGFKHYLQGLVIRKLLWEKMSSEQIAALMAGKDTAELKRLLLKGIAIVPAGGGGDADPTPADAGTWKRIVLGPDVELHLKTPRRALSPEEVEKVLERVRERL
jgi:DNA-binding transcriptional MerR regulator